MNCGGFNKVDFVGIDFHEWMVEHEKHMDQIGLSGIEMSTTQVHSKSDFIIFSGSQFDITA